MTAVATRTSVEIVQFPPESGRAQQWFTALEAGARAHGLDVRRTAGYAGGSAWMVLWGPGAPVRAEAMRRHVADGSHVLALDLAYWARDRKTRVSIDAAHPQAWVMRRDWSSSRLEADGVSIEHRWDPQGPVVIAGLGDKARIQYGPAVVDAWEESMMRACQARWPKRLIRYRRKKPSSAVPAWACLTGGGDIDHVLRGASLLVTWHSNVAVDAIRLGIPVICRDGAAAALCPDRLGEADPEPLADDLRRRFLANLAWFQWKPTEAAALWAFVLELTA